jgi:hypothetical protein
MTSFDLDRARAAGAKGLREHVVAFTRRPVLRKDVDAGHACLEAEERHGEQ